MTDTNTTADDSAFAAADADEFLDAMPASNLVALAGAIHDRVMDRMRDDGMGDDRLDAAKAGSVASLALLLAALGELSS